MPIFRVKSVKIYTGQKNLHWRRRPRRRQLSGMPDSLLLTLFNLLHLGILCEPDFNQFRPCKTTLSILSLIQNEVKAYISVGLVLLYEIYWIFIIRSWIFFSHSEERGSVKSGGREPIAAIAIAAGPPEENARTNGTIWGPNIICKITTGGKQRGSSGLMMYWSEDLKGSEILDEISPGCRCSPSPGRGRRRNHGSSSHLVFY